MPHIDLDSDLLNFLASNEYEPGDRLPTISELQNENKLGVSTSKIREQLEVARALGLVEVRSKTGMRLKEYSFTPAVRLSLLFALAKDVSYFEQFSELRQHVEIAFWHEACSLLTGEDKALLATCIQQARAKLSHPWIQIPNSEHRTFHLTIFSHLNNPFVQGILEAYWDAYDAVEPMRFAEYEYHTKVWDYHERILNAICAGDFEVAREEFIAHTLLLRYESEK